MKKRIGTLYNKPIIEGDINLKTPNEIHKNELKGGGNNPSGGSVSKYAPRYFKIDFSKAGTLWKEILGISDVDTAIEDSELMFTVGALYKIKVDNLVSIQGYPFINIDNDREYSFSYMPLFLPQTVAEAFSIKSLLTFEDMLENICKILVENGKVEYDQVLSMEGLTEITEEEFYKID